MHTFHSATMSHAATRVSSTLAVVLTAALVLIFLSTPAADAKTPETKTLSGIPSRTSMVVMTSKGTVQTSNASEARPGLSIVKLYIADYVLRKGAKTPREKFLVERMISWSDNRAAKILDMKYPNAIDLVAQEYGLSNTWRGSEWGESYTSAKDVATYLNKVQKKRPKSSILQWMRQASPSASDGTKQDWGTAHLADVDGSKWGWSDRGDRTVASASIGKNYTAAAFTFGDPAKQDKDVEKVESKVKR